MIDADWFAVPATVLARRLLGMRLVHDDGEQVRGGRIVEVEAYQGPRDRACHARFGPTERTRSLFGPPGRAYVYLIYGMYDLMNVTAYGEGRGHAVLIRALELPDELRGDGPGRLTRALGITRAHDGLALFDDGALRLEPGVRPRRIGVSARVGVGYAGSHADRKWRFFDADSRAVSRPSPRMIGQGLLGR